MAKSLGMGKNQAGWILMDVLIGMVIVATALTALVAMYTQATKSTTANREYSNAVYVAQQALEDLKQYEGTTTIHPQSLPNNATNISVTLDRVTYTAVITPVAVADPDLDTGHIYPYQVTVTWNNGSHSIQVAAYYKDTP